jgi:hypothetical protein
MTGAKKHHCDKKQRGAIINIEGWKVEDRKSRLDIPDIESQEEIQNFGWRKKDVADLWTRHVVSKIRTVQGRE